MSTKKTTIGGQAIIEGIVMKGPKKTCTVVRKPGGELVTKTEPGFAGNTATNVTKPATVETGAEVKVPLFINEGDKIQIDTRTGEYLGRAKG